MLLSKVAAGIAAGVAILSAIHSVSKKKPAVMMCSCSIQCSWFSVLGVRGGSLDSGPHARTAPPPPPQLGRTIGSRQERSAQDTIYLPGKSVIMNGPDNSLSVRPAEIQAVKITNNYHVSRRRGVI